MILVKGHVLRNHPEKVPNVVKELMASAEQMAKVREQYATQPELWQKLIDYIELRKN